MYFVDSVRLAPKVIFIFPFFQTAVSLEFASLRIHCTEVQTLDSGRESNVVVTALPLPVVTPHPARHRCQWSLLGRVLLLDDLLRPLANRPRFLFVFQAN
jgi:hypothetical protein